MKAETELTVLITGATSGFGLETAKLLAQDGHRLILVGRRGERLAEIAKSLKTEVHTATADITDKSQVKKLIDNLAKDFRDPWQFNRPKEWFEERAGTHG